MSFEQFGQVIVVPPKNGVSSPSYNRIRQKGGKSFLKKGGGTGEVEEFKV